MPYVTPEELIDRLGTREATAISDRQKTGAPDLVVLADALALAEDEVNSYVGRRYALPLITSGGQPAAIPPTVKRLVIDIARYRNTGTEVMETEPIRNRFKDAVKLLEQISRGEINLGDLALVGVGGPTPVGGSVAVRTGAKTYPDLSGVL
ncbi:MULTISPECIES: DUF1320 domain-containing protein [unclassified Polaromonas]|jgi:phage gp36-like protein|uniref:gp436 family protein n=1 Tax=unclassified Polaromonas TaxID=2638319 RepID=UPI000BCECB8B|nr:MULTISPECIES: DUF1320 domain-containing protein [unclassified Polaromonas]OYY34587.1 MAG: hypothetical protein B7Y60_16030 [Polaromonas sp. 35-63-35]OYZ15076.1 MAG: hypothetical protein B7Y28_22670 [Polaromonas sp. 16-63-31]OYZ78853.1 MAG: hypothetical protein B7Y09_11260 [Polaromonas sp. 24-63-21]OZA49633.1 MAG: hypothetical protein B7X88_14570 [Polaromonas sp. 17-63-33]OZA86823.1 MAG: hypothetical protein B7X65_15250 [Polaromonas sp. 39-63-25]